MSIIKQNKSLFVGAIAGALITVALVPLFNNEQNTGGDQAESGEKQPLYWVAPMDPNYKRDKPGKSPMGMDLIPVYAEDEGNGDSGPGTIKISPEVINNLGVRTAEVEMRSLNNQLRTVGYVQYDQDQLVHVHPRVEGWIEHLHIKAEGDPVKQGQPLYDIYSPELVNAQEELLLALERKNSRLIRAAKDRLAALQIPQQAIDLLVKTRKVNQTVRFYAPINGVVDNLEIRQGFFVKPGTTLMSIGNLAQVWVEAEIFERQAFVVNQGDAVSMTLDYLPGREWLGEVDYVYPALDAANRTVKVRLRFDNPDSQLKPNMFAQVVITPKNNPEMLVVPSEAVIRTGSQDRVVLALGEGRFKSIAVKTGRQFGGYSEIISGLDSGETIVSSAQFLLDSESSKSSDFKRMQAPDEVPASVWTSATIHSVMAGHRMLNATHEPIEAWDWPAMTMDFNVAESVDISQLSAGLSLHMQISKMDDGSYTISEIHIMDMGNMDMGDMDRGNMDTGNMQMEQDAAAASARVNGRVNSIDHSANSVNISRGPIEKWDRPAATLDFLIGEGVAHGDFVVGEQIDFTFEIHDGEFVVTQIHQE